MQKFNKLILSIGMISVLSACGGGDSSSEPLSSASCFDIATYTPGPPILHGTEELSGDNIWKSQGISINAILKNNQTHFSVLRVDDSYLLPTRSSQEGYIRDNRTITTDIFHESGTGPRRANAHTVYDPPIEDKKFTLKQGESTTYNTTVTHTITRYLSPDPLIDVYQLNGTITFEGKDQIPIGKRTVEACRFSNGYSLEWFYRGIPVQSARLDGAITRRTTGLTRDGQIY